jgi:nucleotide-binding universal stress UspA family protein
MFKTIVWATDGSEAADLALPYVKSLAKEGDGNVVVFHSREITAGRGGGYTVNVDEEEVVAKIEGQVRELSGDGVRATAKIEGSMVGRAADATAAAAQEVSADVIVVGTRGHTRLSGLLLGSVTQRLLQIATCPVLAVPAAAKPADEQGAAAERATA